MLAVSALFVEPKAVLVELSLEALKRLLAVGLDVGNVNGLWLVEVVAFVPNTPLGREEDIPNGSKPVVLFEGLLSVDGAFVEEDIPNGSKPVVLFEDLLSVDGAAEPNALLGMGDDVPNPPIPNILCEDPLFVDGAAVPMIEPGAVEDGLRCCAKDRACRSRRRGLHCCAKNRACRSRRRELHCGSRSSCGGVPMSLGVRRRGVCAK